MYEKMIRRDSVQSLIAHIHKNKGDLTGHIATLKSCSGRFGEIANALEANDHTLAKKAWQTALDENIFLFPSQAEIIAATIAAHETAA